MTNMIWTTLQEYTNEIKEVYGCHLKMLFYMVHMHVETKNEESDIDIMILVDLDEQNIKDYDAKLSDITFDINLDNDLMIMPIVKNENHFRKWIEAYPFYRNIEKEGVKLYAA